MSCHSVSCQLRYAASKSPRASPAPRGWMRVAPCCSSPASSWVGTAWYVVAHSVLPQPKTVYDKSSYAVGPRLVERVVELDGVVRGQPVVGGADDDRGLRGHMVDVLVQGTQGYVVAALGALLRKASGDALRRPEVRAE